MEGGTGASWEEEAGEESLGITETSSELITLDTTPCTLVELGMDREGDGDGEGEGGSVGISSSTPSLTLRRV